MPVSISSLTGVLLVGLTFVSETTLPADRFVQADNLVSVPPPFTEKMRPDSCTCDFPFRFLPLLSFSQPTLVEPYQRGSDPFLVVRFLQVQRFNLHFVLHNN